MDNNETLAGLTYLYDLYITEICKRKKLTWEKFKQLNNKYKILELITEHQDLFNDWSIEDGLACIEERITKKGN